ncbi:MAG: ATP-binding protein [Myxococcota bacterium]|nr:ATP-binding protein [Myxococcota bacterium]
MDSKIPWERRAVAAEKTVDVLKQRVRSLYNEGAQTAIHQQLDRARKRQEEATRRRALAEARNQALQKHSEMLESQVQERTRHIRTILDNVLFGFAMVDQEGQILECTRSCAELTGREVTVGDNLLDVLGVANDSRGVELILGLDQVFEDFMPEELTLGQIPQRFELAGSTLKVEGRVIRDPEGAVQSVLFTMSDISDLEAARKEAHTNAVLVGILRQKAAFASFVDDARGRIQAAREALSDATFVRRAVHTVKGNAASYGLEQVAKTAHEVEAKEGITAQDLDRVRASLEDFLSANEAILQLSGGGTVEVPVSVMENLRALLNPLNAQGLAQWGAEIVQRPVRDIVGPLEVFVDRLAERLGRRVDFTLEGADVLVDPQATSEVLNNLSHLIRNAVDHGLEPPDQRGDKPEVGRLSLRVVRSTQSWVIQVEDDGRGVDVDTMVSKAIAKGTITAQEVAAMDHEAKLELIFIDGLSSREEASEISGRGVGMSAVREAVTRSGGHMDIWTKAGHGTRFTLHIPVPEAGAMAA